MVRSVTPAGRLSGPRVLSRIGWAGYLGGLSLLVPALVLGGWLAVHRIPGFGPWVADTLRAVIGVDGVARLEELVYGVEDRFNSVWRRGEKPRAYWVVPPEPAPVVAAPVPAPAVLADGEAPAAVALPPFRPGNVGPMYESCAAPGDGQWVPLP